MQFKRDITPLVDHFDYVGGQEGFLFLNGFMSAARSHPGLNSTLNFIDTLGRVPLEMRLELSNQPSFYVGFGALTLGMDKGTKEGSPILLIHKNEGGYSNPYYQVNHMESWIKYGFGQSSILARNFRANALYFSKKSLFRSVDMQRWKDLKEEGNTIIEAFSSRLFGQSREDIQAKRRALVERSEKAFYGLEKKPEKIPRTHHQMWITDGYEIPELHLLATVSRARTLGRDWQNIFWCVDPGKIPESIERLRAEIPALEIRKIEDYFGEEEGKTHMYGEDLYQRFLREKYFVMASNIVRKNALHEYGGLYTDMGLTFKKDPTHFLDYDMLFFLQPETALLDEGLLGVPKKHRVFSELLRVYDNLKRFPKELQEINSQTTNICVVGMHLFHSYLMKYLDEEEVILPLEQGVLIENTSTGSWIHGKYGNKPFDTIKTIFE
ncbi:hypothetical protein OAN21_02770 [Alphaproteobacteria bacterium]|nr:hypothetical protein [Alphaproteobacteria bacterium]